MFLNARMVASIAHLRGWDLQDEAVRSSILVTMAGSTPAGLFSAFGVDVGQKLTVTAIRRVPIEVIRKINKRVGFMLIAKYGTKRSAITLTKAVPVVGGVVGATVDATYTKTVSTVAKRAFPDVTEGPAMDDAGETPR